MKRFKRFTSKAALDAERAHYNKLSNADGHPIPETQSMHVSGAGVDRSKLPWNTILKRDRVPWKKHPTRNVWVMYLNEFARSKGGHVDLASAHAIDLKDATEAAPDELGVLSMDLAVMTMEMG